MLHKAKGQHDADSNLNRLALAHSCPCSSARIERPPTKRRVVSSNLATGTPLVSPAHSVNCGQGLTSDARPKAGLIPTVILSLRSGESKVQNDLPQLPPGDGQGGFLRREADSALEVPAVRQAVL